MFLGLMPYLAPKGQGNSSMAANQWSCPGVWSDALGDPRDMAKAKLPESQSPEDAMFHPPERRLKPVPLPALAWHADERTPRKRSDPQRADSRG
jgi:hypothetical protein